MAGRHDVIVIGGGHNGLACGAYLSRAGLKVLVLERRPVTGAPALLAEFPEGGAGLFRPGAVQPEARLQQDLRFQCAPVGVTLIEDA